MPSKRTDTIQVIMPSGRIKLNIKVCELCDVVFIHTGKHQDICSQTPFCALFT